MPKLSENSPFQVSNINDDDRKNYQVTFTLVAPSSFLFQLPGTRIGTGIRNSEQNSNSRYSGVLFQPQLEKFFDVNRNLIFHL